jgi:hypothetical protein
MTNAANSKVNCGDCCRNCLDTRGQAHPLAMYFIHEGKVRAPAAAMALIDKLGATKS